ncbi:MAG: hypothetical protein WCG75_12195, partial [Armatimonadota bacterium]
MAHLQVGRVGLLGVEPGVAEDHATAIENLNHRVEPRVVGVRGCPDSADDLAQAVDRQAQLAADDPAVIGDAGFRPLRRVAAVAHQV